MILEILERIFMAIGILAVYYIIAKFITDLVEKGGE